jgi:hypothetical protein
MKDWYWTRWFGGTMLVLEVFVNLRHWGLGVGVGVSKPTLHQYGVVDVDLTLGPLTVGGQVRLYRMEK